MYSYSTRRPLPTVRDIPSIVSAAGAIQISSIVAPVGVSCCQQPAIQDSCCILVGAFGIPCSRIASRRNRATSRTAIHHSLTTLEPRTPNPEPRTPNVEPNLNTNREPRTRKCELPVACYHFSVGPDGSTE